MRRVLTGVYQPTTLSWQENVSNQKYVPRQDVNWGLQIDHILQETALRFLNLEAEVDGDDDDYNEADEDEVEGGEGTNQIEVTGVSTRSILQIRTNCGIHYRHKHSF
jgi:hypothetical protein